MKSKILISFFSLQVFVLMQFDPGMEYRPDWGFGSSKPPLQPPQGNPNSNPAQISRMMMMPFRGGANSSSVSKGPSANTNTKTVTKASGGGEANPQGSGANTNPTAPKDDKS